MRPTVALLEADSGRYAAAGTWHKTRFRKVTGWLFYKCYDCLKLDYSSAISSWDCIVCIWRFRRTPGRLQDYRQTPFEAQEFDKPRILLNENPRPVEDAENRGSLSSSYGAVLRALENRTHYPETQIKFAPCRPHHLPQPPQVRVVIHRKTHNIE